MWSVLGGLSPCSVAGGWGGTESPRYFFTRGIRPVSPCGGLVCSLCLLARYLLGAQKKGWCWIISNLRTQPPDRAAPPRPLCWLPGFISAHPVGERPRVTATARCQRPRAGGTVPHKTGRPPPASEPPRELFSCPLAPWLLKSGGLTALACSPEASTPGRHHSPRLAIHRRPRGIGGICEHKEHSHHSGGPLQHRAPWASWREIP